MKSLINLVRNEHMKIYARTGSWLMLGMVVFLSSLWSLIWRVAGFSSSSYWTIVLDMTRFIFFISLFTIIIAGGIVAREYEWGTIKLLLIRPISRGKVLLAKYITVLLYAVELLAVLFTVSMIINYLVFWVQGIQNGEVMINSRKSWLTGTLSGVAILYGLRWVEVWFYGTIAFVLSIISRNSTTSMGITFITMVFGPEATAVIPKGLWVRFYPFALLDLSSPLLSDLEQPAKVLVGSLLMIMGFMLVLLTVGWYIFRHRDVLD